MKFLLTIIFTISLFYMKAGDVLKTGKVKNSNNTWKVEFMSDGDTEYYLYSEMYPTGDISKQGKIKKDGSKYGEWKAFYVNGSIWTRMYYINDKLHGTQFSYREDGSIFLSGEYINGLKNGCFRQFNMDLTIIISREYIDGINTGRDC
jgi:antitoxin component YwqK of YwqJK toxin-antitoxin module